MDIRCRFCGEPIDTYEFHNGTDSWYELVRLFKQFGCPVAEKVVEGMSADEVRLEVTTPCTRKPCVSEDGLLAIQVLTELNGDDIDGLAANLDDCRWM